VLADGRARFIRLHARYLRRATQPASPVWKPERVRDSEVSRRL
jgi:hypothetical protein